MRDFAIDRSECALHKNGSCDSRNIDMELINEVCDNVGSRVAHGEFDGTIVLNHNIFARNTTLFDEPAHYVEMSMFARVLESIQFVTINVCCERIVISMDIALSMRARSACLARRIKCFIEPSHDI